jgi:hypothetical protein
VRRLPGEIVLNVALLRFRAISQLILAQNIFLSISLRRSFCKRLKKDAIYLISAEFVSYPPEVFEQERIACRE